MSKETGSEDISEKSNQYYKVKGNPLDGYYRDQGYDPNPMEYNPFMARLGILIMCIVATVVVTSVIMSS